MRVMMFNATFNNISAISWRSVWLVEETGVNHRPVVSHWQTLSHNVWSSTLSQCGIRPHNVSGADAWLVLLCLSSLWFIYMCSFMIFYNVLNKLKTNKVSLLSNIPNSNWLTVVTETKSTDIHDRSFFWIGTGLSVKSGGIKLVLWAQTFGIVLGRAESNGGAHPARPLNWIKYDFYA